jgi:hypothetical protein
MGARAINSRSLIAEVACECKLLAECACSEAFRDGETAPRERSGMARRFCGRRRTEEIRRVVAVKEDKGDKDGNL